ncbi:hypothetical protein GTG28_04825 [Vibrio sp. OCN044]|uniref:Uncharacterized protein n=1 Tax=Vibrio tetraodonis subsp. pristinus TaxID=2695891 RepID=A0A6L8LR35_9VIBR|nr:hypothetical protein [Vibrio tetraodonis]MYM58541.1 hypothetical protein [Vibrio tetraodonis subsp. pristinus]
MNNLIDFAQVIGSGLSNKQCYLSLQRVNQQEGTFWSYRADNTSGIWCSKHEWSAGIEVTSSLTTIPDDLLPTMVAALFSVVGIPFVRDINTKGEDRQLPNNIYPVVQCNGYQFVLVGFSAAWIKRLTIGWESYLAPQVTVSVPLIAGYLTDTKPIFNGQGVWLKDGHNPNKGCAILWWGKPVASVQYKEEKTWFVNDTYPSYSLPDKTSYVKIASLDVSLQDLLNLENGNTFEADLVCEAQSKVISGNQCVTKGELVVSPDGVVFYANDSFEISA